MTDRFNPAQVDQWRRDGGVVIPDFFTPDEIADVAADFVTVFGRTEGGQVAKNHKKPGEVGRFNDAQFTGTGSLPFNCSPSLNLIGLHPQLIAFARQALKSEQVYLYQCQAWAKYTGDADYDQPFHCDFVNHTLTVPSENAHMNSITIICYFSDVEEADGPMHYVTRTDSLPLTGPEGTLIQEPQAFADLQTRLSGFEKSTAGRAGTIFPYSIDVFHRATNMTRPGGHRFAVMSCFRAADDNSIGFHAWPFHFGQPWHRIFDSATPEQLGCLGVQLPGHPFWTETTIARAQTRYPNWDLTPYRLAMAKAAA